LSNSFPSLRIIAVLIITGLLASILGYNYLFNNTFSSKGSNKAETFNRAVTFLNRTSSHVADKKPSYDVNPAALLRIRRDIVSGKNKILYTPGANYSEIILYDTYDNISLAALKLYNVTLDLPVVWAGMERSMDELSNLNIRKALSIYYSLRYRLYNIIEELRRTQLILLYTEKNGILLDEHNITVQHALYVINNTLATLLEYMKMMEILLQAETQYMNTHNKTYLLQLARTLSQQIDMNNLKPFAKQLALFLTRLSISEEMEKKNEKINMTRQENPGGLGGGYTGSSEDD
jgi:hypothetical protein